MVMASVQSVPPSFSDFGDEPQATPRNAAMVRTASLGIMVPPISCVPGNLGHASPRDKAPGERCAWMTDPSRFRVFRSMSQRVVPCVGADVLEGHQVALHGAAVLAFVGPERMQGSDQLTVAVEKGARRAGFPLNDEVSELTTFALFDFALPRLLNLVFRHHAQ